MAKGYPWEPRVGASGIVPSLDTSASRLRSGAGNGVDVTFIGESADVSSSVVAAPDTLPAGFRLLPAASVYDVSADGDDYGPATVCIEPQGEAPNWKTPLLVLHEEDGIWVDRTTYADLETGQVCAEVDHLSLFALGYFKGGGDDDDDDDEDDDGGEDHDQD